LAAPGGGASRTNDVAENPLKKKKKTPGDSSPVPLVGAAKVESGCEFEELNLGSDRGPLDLESFLK